MKRSNKKNRQEVKTGSENEGRKEKEERKWKERENRWMKGVRKKKRQKVKTDVIVADGRDRTQITPHDTRREGEGD